MTEKVERWRVSKHNELDVYEGDRPICQTHSERDARRIVIAMNRDADFVDCAADASKQSHLSHLVDGQFQSDKYPTCPPGKVPLSTRDRAAQDLLAIYASRREALDPDFSHDLLEALKLEGYRDRPPAELAALIEVAAAARRWLELWQSEGAEGRKEDMQQERSWPAVEEALVNALDDLAKAEQERLLRWAESESAAETEARASVAESTLAALRASRADAERDRDKAYRELAKANEELARLRTELVNLGVTGAS